MTDTAASAGYARRRGRIAWECAGFGAGIIGFWRHYKRGHHVSLSKIGDERTPWHVYVGLSDGSVPYSGELDARLGADAAKRVALAIFKEVIP